MPAKMLWPEKVACPDLETIFDDGLRLADYSNYPRGRLPATAELKKWSARLTRALGVASSALNLTAAYSGATPAGLTFCPLLNISQCPATETGSDSLTVTLYNPLGRPVTEYVRLPVVAAQYEVVGPGGATLPAQLVQIPGQLAKGLIGVIGENAWEKTVAGG